MRSIWIVIAIAACFAPPIEAQAFSACQDFFATPDELQAFVIEKGVNDAPMKYYEAARAIQVVTSDESGRLIPFATFDGSGQPVVVYPVAFPPVLCRMALATYLVMQDEDWRPMAEAARDTAGCIDSGQSRAACLMAYAASLERGYRAIFDAQSARDHETAYAIAYDAVAQFARHEFAHHLLGHRDRMRAGAIKRIDAEFEADFYALQSGVETGESPSAMFYFFKPLADMEDYSSTAGTADYESGSCRATNVNDITGLFGMAPMLVLDAVEGGRQYGNGSISIGEVAQELLQQPSPAPSADSCGRLAAAVLQEAHGELGRLTATVAAYADLLKASPSDQDTGEGIALDGPAALELIERIKADSSTFTQLNGLAARVLSVLLLRVSLGGANAAISAQLEEILRTSGNDILSNDFGRLQQVNGTNILYLDPGRPLEARMDQAQPILEAAVTHLPDAFEAWLNLALIAFARGDCEYAIGLADEATRHAANEAVQNTAIDIRDSMQQYVQDGECAERAANFAASFAQ